MDQQSQHMEGRFDCRIDGKSYEYMVSYAGFRSVDWHATIRSGSRYSWSTGTLPHNVKTGPALEEAIRAQVLATISICAG